MEDELIKKLELYVKNYDIENENIKRKYYHSLRVMGLAEKIAQSLNLDECNIKLATVAGILHDYGRFEQWKKFNTYSDVESIDHGDLAVELLFNQNEIINFYNNTDSYNKLYNAIRMHNKLNMDTNLDDDTQLLCKIVRDADKLDIYNLLIDNKNLFMEDMCEITEKVKKEFFLENNIDYRDIKSKSDKIILILATFYDLNFNYSLEYIKINHIVDKLYDNIENKEKYKMYFEKIYSYLDNKNRI